MVFVFSKCLKKTALKCVSLLFSVEMIFCRIHFLKVVKVVHVHGGKVQIRKIQIVKKIFIFLCLPFGLFRRYSLVF